MEEIRKIVNEIFGRSLKDFDYMDGNGVCFVNINRTIFYNELKLLKKSGINLELITLSGSDHHIRLGLSKT